MTIYICFSLIRIVLEVFFDQTISLPYELYDVAVQFAICSLIIYQMGSGFCLVEISNNFLMLTACNVHKILLEVQFS